MPVFVGIQMTGCLLAADKNDKSNDKDKDNEKDNDNDNDKDIKRRP